MSRALGWLLATAWILSGCGTSGSIRPEAVEMRDETGFSITEKVRVGFGVRSDFEKAMRLLKDGEHERGIALLQELTEAAPQATAAHINLGIAYARVDDLENARDSLETALSLNPRHPVALNELGIVYRRSGRFAEARSSYERALELYPDFHFARRNLAILCDLYLSDPSCAEKHYELYTRAVPDDQEAAIWVADLRNRTAR